MASTPLFDPDEHEPLRPDAWDESIARAFVRETLRAIDDAFDAQTAWPLHPEDRDPADDNVPVRGLYLGHAGTIWALVRLAQTNDVALAHDYGAAIAACEERYRANPRETDTVVPGYGFGSVGIMMARFAVTGDRAVLDRLGHDMRSNAGNVAREWMWGTPGTVIPALLLREHAGDRRFDDIIRNVQDELWATWPAGEGELLWEQDLYGRRRHFVGAAHGAIGNLLPFVRAADLLAPERAAAVADRVPRLLDTYAIRDGDATNWATFGNPISGNRLQWCHGAAGVILGLAAYPRHDPRVESALIAGGEAIWRAGPVRKGPTLCHGTAGNGFALLRLAHRTGDARWHERAQRFAMHAIRQSAAWRVTYGGLSPSFWSGDMGVAHFVDAVLRDDPAMLTQDVL